jgi:TIR domain
MTEFPENAFPAIWLLVKTISVIVGLHKWGQEKAKKEEEERQAEEAEQRSQEMLRLQRESRNLLEKIETRRIGDYFVADAPIAEIDFFISHATEDKDSFVRSLAKELSLLGARVFYDEFSLKVGDSLRRSVDRGLSASKFGVVVLSEPFFKKEWPARELDGLVAQETAGRTRILPIWHKVTKDDVLRHSPTLADKVERRS